MILDKELDAYVKDIRSFKDSMGTLDITWYHRTTGLTRWGGPARGQSEVRGVTGWFLDDFLRADFISEGLSDTSLFYVLLHIGDLKDKGYLTADGSLDIDMGYDYFKIRGMDFMINSLGLMAQAGSTHLFYAIYLKPKTPQVG